jgi:DNA invertase Pin-like site-specific DNA recombinase
MTRGFCWGFSILQGLHEKGAGLFLHPQGLDTTTTAGKAMFQMLGVFAEFERGIIRERVNAGLARAKAKGTKLGRRRVKPSVEARILELRGRGRRYAQDRQKARHWHQRRPAGLQGSTLEAPINLIAPLPSIQPPAALVG